MTKIEGTFAVQEGGPGTVTMTVGFWSNDSKDAVSKVAAMLEGARAGSQYRAPKKKK